MGPLTIWMRVESVFPFLKANGQDLSRFLNTQIRCNNNLPLGIFTIRNIHTIVQYVSVMEKNLRQTTCSSLMLSMAKL